MNAAESQLLACVVVVVVVVVIVTVLQNQRLVCLEPHVTRCAFEYCESVPSMFKLQTS